MTIQKVELAVDITHIDVRNVLTVNTPIRLYKIVLNDSFLNIMKDIFYKGLVYDVGDSVYVPATIESDEYESFIYTGVCAFDSIDKCKKLMEMIERSYPYMFNTFNETLSIIAIDLEIGSKYYYSIDYSIFVVESFKVLEVCS